MIDGMMVFGFIVVVVGISIVLFDKFYLSKKRKLQGNFIRILLFEQVGNEKVYLGETIGISKVDDKIGVVVNLKKYKASISGVNPDLFFFDKKFGKTLLVCRFSEEDYRPMQRLVHRNFFVKEVVKEQKVDKNGELVFKEVEVVDPETAEVRVEKIPVFVDVEKLVEYKEPLGVSQTAREALRFNKDFAKRMQEKRGEKAGWWDKYGTFVMTGAFLLIILISTAYNANKFEQSAKHIASVFDENMEDAIDTVNSPSFITNLVKQLENKEKEANAPPS